VVKFHAPEMSSALGRWPKSGFAAARLGGRRPFVVTDDGVHDAGWVHELLGHLRDVGLAPTVWRGVTANPKDTEITAGYHQYAESGCDVLIGIGGGSVMDAAKGIAILSGNSGSILDYARVDQVLHPNPPLLMIPTTSGTGADVSQFCIVTDTVRAVKVTIMGRALVPDTSITDPRLLTTMPEWLNAATGLDAPTHGIEAFASLAHNPLADGHALSTVRLVGHYLPATIHRPDDMESRQQMAQASLEAGLAFINAILGATLLGPAAAALGMELDRARGLTQEAIAQLRDAIYALHHAASGDSPSSLQDLLTELASHYRPRLQVQVRVEGGSTPIETGADQELARIAGEALFNVATHADADRAVVRLQYRPDSSG
jgi:alcohol dehydrogenase class IV